MSICIEIYTPKTSPYANGNGITTARVSPYTAKTLYLEKASPYSPICFQAPIVSGYLFQDGSPKSFMNGDIFEFN